MRSFTTILLLSLTPAHGDIRSDYKACESTFFPRMIQANRNRTPVQPVSPADQYCYGLAYATGYTIRQNPAEAVRWYQAAAKQNHAGAQTALAYQIEKGRGVAQSFEAAVFWYRKAAATGNDDAMFNLGRMYRGGYGVAKDEAVAIEWFQRAAKGGNVLAQRLLAVRSNRSEDKPGQTEFTEGKKFFDAKRYGEAAQWFGRSAAVGNPRAQSFLGVMHEEGLGVPKNDATAAAWYGKAAGQGYSIAQRALGLMYENGKGVRESWAEALQWYRKSAAQNDKEGLFSLGRMYQFGMAVPQDRWKAIELFEKAGGQDHPKANYFAKWLREGSNCIGIRDESEDNWRGVCADPVGKTFHNSGQRKQWLGEMAAEMWKHWNWSQWNNRKSEYDQCMHSRKSACADPGPEPAK